MAYDEVRGTVDDFVDCLSLLSRQKYFGAGDEPVCRAFSPRAAMLLQGATTGPVFGRLNAAHELVSLCFPFEVVVYLRFGVDTVKVGGANAELYRVVGPVDHRRMAYGGSGKGPGHAIVGAILMALIEGQHRPGHPDAAPEPSEPPTPPFEATG